MRVTILFVLAISPLSSLQAQTRVHQETSKTMNSDGGGSSSSPLVIRIRDKCDPTTFNLNVGPGACVGDGNVTFQAFIAELTEDKKMGAWRFNPDQTDAMPGQPTVIESRGGETHTFTKVKEFGGGVVLALNALSDNPEPRYECADPKAVGPAPGVLAFAHGVSPIMAGEIVEGPHLLSKDQHEQKFQCCIHPWMRLIVTAKR